MAYGTLALEAAMAPILGAWLGSIIDRHWMISPWALIAGVILGLGVSVRVLRDLIRQTNKDDGNDS
jgi:F0F1-type ATP synthase assembly protein I